MSRIVLSRLLAASVVLTLAAAPVLAQVPGAPRTTTATGVTKPPTGRDKAAAPRPPYNRASTEADMLKAQRVAAARDKAWDQKMRTTMGSICQGC